MKNQCEGKGCQAELKSDSLAYMCCYQCAFCAKCADQLKEVCPNCGQELVPRGRKVEKDNKDNARMLVKVARCKEENLQDAARLFDLYRQFYKQPSDFSAAENYLRQRLLQGEAVIFLAKVKNQFVGFTQLYPLFSSIRMAPVWVLNDLYVTSDARGMGVAQSLIERAAMFAQNLGGIRLVLSTASDNVHAQALYEKLNFKKDNEYFHYSLTL